MPTGALAMTYRPSGPVVPVTGVPTTKTFTPAIGCLLASSTTVPVILARRVVAAGDVVTCPANGSATAKNAVPSDTAPSTKRLNRPTSYLRQLGMGVSGSGVDFMALIYSGCTDEMSRVVSREPYTCVR